MKKKKKKQQKPTNPRVMFLLADRFHALADVMWEYTKAQAPLSPGKPGLLEATFDFAKVQDLAPSLVIDSFALELYLKCIHVIDTGTPPLGHDPGALFRALPLSHQKKLEHLLSEYLKTPEGAPHAADMPNGMEDALARMNGIFEIFRYIYEKEGDTTPMFYNTIPRLLVRQFILELKPEWKQLPQVNVPTSPIR